MEGRGQAGVGCISPCSSGAWWVGLPPPPQLRATRAHPLARRLGAVSPSTMLLGEPGVTPNACTRQGRQQAGERAPRLHRLHRASSLHCGASAHTTQRTARLCVGGGVKVVQVKHIHRPIARRRLELKRACRRRRTRAPQRRALRLPNMASDPPRPGRLPPQAPGTIPWPSPTLVCLQHQSVVSRGLDVDPHARGRLAHVATHSVELGGRVQQGDGRDEDVGGGGVARDAAVGGA